MTETLNGSLVGPPGAHAALSIWDQEDTPEVVDHDFDASWEERGIRPKRVRILGKLYDLPVEPPAMFVLFQARHRNSDKNAKVSPQEIVDLLGAIIGKANVDELLHKGIGLTRLADVMKYCMDAMKESRQGEAPAPNQGAETASGTSA